jgi:DNA invertase Pin-like site-specific DNA recombinase
MTTTATFSSRPAGITDSHVARYALIYLRQSSLSQVEHNVGSTARQYKAKDLAQEWGWPEDRIIVVDDDLGTSSTQAGKRRGFAHVLDLINRGQVGALFTVHADRLARNLLEFAQIVTLCEKHFVPLVIDGELKDLHETHDRLLTILLGVFAEHENRDRAHKLRSAMIAKIRDHHYAQGTPPAGYDATPDAALPAMRGRVWGGHWSKSTDPAVVSAIDQIFTLFQSLGTPGAVVRELIRQGLAIPKRVMQGLQYGAVVFSPPTSSRVRAILRNPNFTAAFVYAKTHRHDSGHLRQDGTGPLKVGRRPREEWLIVRDHHEPYISWEQRVARSPAPNTTTSTETWLTRAEYRRSRPLRLRAGGRQRLATAPARR